MKEKIAKARENTASSEQAIAVAEKVKLAAQIPTGATSALEGTITTDTTAGFTAELAAYDTMARMADQIAARINGLKLTEPRILIVDTLGFSGADVLALQVEEQLAFWLQELGDYKAVVNDLLGKPPDDVAADLAMAAALLPLATGILSGVADVVGYFRINYDIKGRAVEKSNTALQLRVAKGLDCPAFLPYFHRMKTSSIITSFRQCLGERQQLLLVLAELKGEVIDKQLEEIKALGERIKALETELAGLKASENEDRIAEINTELGQKRAQFQAAEKVKGDAEAALARAEVLVKAFDEFNKELNTAPTGKEVTHLALAATRKYLDDNGISHLLYVSIISAGAESIAGKGLFKSGQMAYLGGGLVTYALADELGQILDSDTLGGSSYVKFKLGQDHPPSFTAW